MENLPNGETHGADRISKLPQLADPHPNFPSFSSAVSVRHEKSRGRYCVAGRPIEVGELIAVERPHVAMLDRAEAPRCCWHCFRALLAPVPCAGCSGVLFCGPRCRDEAAAAYHAFECGITELFFQAGVGCWPLAYRVVRQDFT